MLTRPAAARLVARLLAALFGVAMMLAAPGPARAQALVAGWNDFVPYAYAGPDGQVTGFAMDLLTEIAREEGMTLVFEAHPNPKALMEALADARVDIGIALAPTAERARLVHFTRTVATLRIGVFALTDRAAGLEATGLAGHRVGVARGSFSAGLSERVPGAALHEAATNRDLVFDLLSGQLDAVLYPEDAFWRLVISLGVEGRFASVGAPLVETPLSFAVARDQAGTLARLDAALARLADSPQMAELRKKWFVEPPGYWTTPRIVLHLAAAAALAVVSAGAGWLVLAVRLNRQMERRLAVKRHLIGKSQRFLETAFRTFQDPVALIGADGQILYKSRTVMEFLGYPARDRLLADLPPQIEAWDMQSDAPLAEADRPVLRALAGESVHGMVVRFRDARGEHRYLDMTAVPVPGEDGEARSALLCTRDITMERRARYAAEAADRTKSRFLAVMSHEIRTPLNAVLGMFELIARADIPERQRRMAEAGFAASERLFRLLTDVLEVTRLEARAVAPRVRPVRLPDLVAEWMATGEAILSKTGKPVGIQLSACLGGDATVVLDDARLTQIVTNLLDNAAKFTDAGAVRLTVVLKRKAGAPPRLLVRVRDSGIGISQADAMRVFDAFAQAGEPPPRRSAGSGLGLSISRSLAEMMGGTLTLRSAPGHGSLFTLSIPLPAPDAAPPPDRHPFGPGVPARVAENADSGG